VSLQISYMGTKRKLASVVSDSLKSLPEGPVLDAFSGMCAVGEAIAPARQIWTNDVQVFPGLVGKALFCSSTDPISSERAKRIIETHFRRNLKALEDRFKGYLKKERKYLATESLEDVIAGNGKLPYVGNDSNLDYERKRLARKTSTFPYRLATITYVGSFFGAKQCMEIDSLRYAIDHSHAKANIDGEQRDWLIIVLGQVLSRINNSTGQFAQYIKPNYSNIQRIIEKRRRSVWNEFFLALDSVSPVSTQEWRSRNRSFCSDALVLLNKMRNWKYRPSIVYADPPYSSAQYSRYYHVLDVLLEYRYPPVTGVGRYPPKRFQTPFAHSTGVFNALSKLVDSASKLRACLVLSYPENGLFSQRGGNIVELLRRHYKNVDVVYKKRQQHSTFGGPRAAAKVSVVENVYVANI